MAIDINGYCYAIYYKKQKQETLFMKTFLNLNNEKAFPITKGLSIQWYFELIVPKSKELAKNMKIKLSSFLKFLHMMGGMKESNHGNYT